MSSAHTEAAHLTKLWQSAAGMCRFCHIDAGEFRTYRQGQRSLIWWRFNSHQTPLTLSYAIPH